MNTYDASPQWKAEAIETIRDYRDGKVNPVYFWFVEGGEWQTVVWVGIPTRDVRGKRFLSNMLTILSVLDVNRMSKNGQKILEDLCAGTTFFCDVSLNATTRKAMPSVKPFVNRIARKTLSGADRPEECLSTLGEAARDYGDFYRAAGCELIEIARCLTEAKSLEKSLKSVSRELNRIRI